MDIYISNLPQNLDENHLRILFEPFGEVVLTTIVRDSNSGQSKGFGFVNLLDDDDARKAIEDMNGRELAGKVLLVKEAVKGYSKTSPQYDPDKESPNKNNHRRQRVFNNPDGGNFSNFDPEPENNEKIDLEVKDEASFSMEKEENGFVQIRFKR